MEKNNQIELYYGYEESCYEVYHAFEAVDPAMNPDSDEIAKELAERLVTEPDSDQFSWDSMLIEIPDSVIERIKADAIREYQERTGSASQQTGAESIENTQGETPEEAVYTWDETHKIVEIFEQVLDAFNITLPSPEDNERDEDNCARLYGSTYAGLFDAVEAVLDTIADQCKAGADVIKYQASTVI